MCLHLFYKDWVMNVKQLLILLCTALFLTICVPGIGEAITMSGSADLNTYGTCSGSCRTIANLNILTTIEGCPMVPANPKPGYSYVGYIPHSCKSLSTTVTVTVTNQDTGITSIDLEAEQAVNCSLSYIITSSAVEAVHNCQGRMVSDSVHGDSIVLTQSIDLDAAKAQNPQYVLVDTCAMINAVHPYQAGSSGTATCLPVMFDYNDIGSPSLKGSAKDNPNTDFDGDSGECRARYGLPDYFINTSTANLVVQDTDFSYSGLGPATDFTRTWNSGSTQPGLFGNNWVFAYESTIVKTCSSATLKKGSGQVLTYEANLCGTLTYPVSTSLPPGSPSGNFDKLTYMAGNYWIYERKDTLLKHRYDLKPGSTDTYRLTSIIDNNSNSQQITYNDDGTIKSVIDAAGRTTTFAYDANKHCTRMTIPDGRYAVYTYDANGNMALNNDLLGTAIAYAYDADNYITSINYAGKTIGFTYAPISYGFKRISTVTDANGNRRTYGANSLTSTYVIDALNTTIWYTNQDGMTTGKVNNSTGQGTFWTYTNGLPVTFTDANGNTTLAEYDASGNLTKVTDPLSNSTTIAYDGNSNPIAVTNPLSKVWTYTYDGNSNLTKISSPLGNEKSYTYDTKGQITAAKDENGNTFTFTYDSFGNVKTLTDSYGKISTIGYDADGFNGITWTDRLGKVSQFSYDNNGRINKITFADGSNKSFAYDACSLTSVTDENGKTTAYERNGLLFITGIVDPLGNTTRMGYDVNNNRVSITDALARATTVTYDSAGRPTRVRNPGGGTIVMAFDKNSNMLSLEDERSKKTTFTYDANNKPTSIQDPLSKTATFTRDALGSVTKKTAPDGASISYAYDDVGRLTGKTYTGGNVAYGYNATSNLTLVTDTTGTTSFTYNKLNRLTSISYPDSFSLSYIYDAARNIQSITYPGGLVVSYTYDSRNRISSASWGTGDSLTYTYDPTGNVLKERRSNGTESNYSYDGNSRVIKIEHKKGSDIFANMDYKRDAVGNTTEATVTLPISPILTSESITAENNGVNQTTALHSAWGSDSFTYDANGNLTRIEGNGGSKPLSAVYDGENRPTSLTLDGVATAYIYNGLGLKTKAVSGAQTRNFHHDPSGKLMFETDGNGTVTTWYIYTGKRLSSMAKPSGGKYFYHFDKTGNTIALTDQNGNVASAYAYEPFGKVSNKTGAVANPFTYVGAFGVMDEGNGIYYMKNRYYDASTGKFLQKDPIGFAGGINMYAYVGNNPVDSIDPEGTDWGDVGWGLGFSSITSLIQWTYGPPALLTAYVAGPAIAIVGAGMAGFAIGYKVHSWFVNTKNNTTSGLANSNATCTEDVGDNAAENRNELLTSTASATKKLINKGIDATITQMLAPAGPISNIFYLGGNAENSRPIVASYPANIEKLKEESIEDLIKRYGPIKKY